MAGTGYSEIWPEFIAGAADECCTTGKCKSCPVSCGAKWLRHRKHDPRIAARALALMHQFEKKRQLSKGKSPLGIYTSRMLTRKAMEQFKEAGETDHVECLKREFSILDKACKALTLTKKERRLLSNDSHALVVDGLDRHRIWDNALQL